ncbi:MAG: histidine kinase [Flavobacteriales bacterium]|nr:histidine kinase [Flavobacteriales bacterium]
MGSDELFVVVMVMTLTVLIAVALVAVLLVLNSNRRVRFDREAATLETQALRSQMNPHFIFNALNSINAYVQQNDTDKATRFLSKFAQVMRGVLENSREATVPLADDLRTLKGYMDLERMRAQERFTFTIEVADDLNPEVVMVPPLVVQPFVENAIWHGLAGVERDGHISLRILQKEGQLLWIVEDNGVGRRQGSTPKAEQGKKRSLGTAITRSRLDLVQKQYGGKAGFHYEDLEQGTRVVVEMPLMVG